MKTDTLLQEFKKDMELPQPFQMEGPGVYLIPLDEGLFVKVIDLGNGFTLFSYVVDVPHEKEEEFFKEALLANLFGQGTKGGVLGLSDDARLLTLTQTIDYDIHYKEFRDIIEDFINAVDFWREEALNYR